MKDPITSNNPCQISVHGNVEHCELIKLQDKDEIKIYEFSFSGQDGQFPEPISLRWKIPGLNVKGVWKPTSDLSKRIQADWELWHLESRISVDAPVICLYGHDDTNIMTFACSDAIGTVESNARLREEDNHFYCHITFFSEAEKPLREFRAQLRLDFRKIHFSESLNAVSKWWESFDRLRPISVPEIAKRPVYSTWYQFHQDLDEDLLLRECGLASTLGYQSIIIDDGWQTKDSNRGYDFTGDWRPDRIPQMSAFVDKIHGLGMKVALWYSVPFCGVRSKAYQRFKGKFLTENHRWAPVFDPRYPEVREYLIELYTKAAENWNLDGFKLDFIDDFRRYDDTPMGSKDGRDYASINEAVDRLLGDVIANLKEVNPEIFIEFRQKYTGPAMRKYGNMFRAFDCPGDAVMNRVRIADIKMLCGATAVHADMVTWHRDEPVEVAALQLVNSMFAVPQLSVSLQDCREDELNMIRFYTKYWNEHSNILMQGRFKPLRPLANYPVQQVVKNDFMIFGVHDDYVVPLGTATDNIHFLNAQLKPEIVVKCSRDFGIFDVAVYDCEGNGVSTQSIELSKGAIVIQVPPCGLIKLKKS